MNLNASPPPPLLPLDLGEPVAPVRPPSWRQVRLTTIEAQGGRCAVCGAAPTTKAGAPRLDVHLAASGIAVALCQSHRLRHDAPTRIPAGVRTRKLNRGQPVISIPRSAHPSPADTRTPDDLLVIEALTRAHVDGAVTSGDAACLALLSVLREHGMIPHAVAVAARKRRLEAASVAVPVPLLDVGPPTP